MVFLSLFLDVLMIPFLRDSTSLDNTVRTMPENVAGAHLMARMTSSSSGSGMFTASDTFWRGPAESLIGSSRGGLLLGGLSK
jgi:hypothetical protein